MRGIKRLIGSAMLGVLALAVLYFTAPYTGVCRSGEEFLTCF